MRHGLQVPPLRCLRITPIVSANLHRVRVWACSVRQRANIRAGYLGALWKLPRQLPCDAALQTRAIPFTGASLTSFPRAPPLFWRQWLPNKCIRWRRQCVGKARFGCCPTRGGQDNGVASRSWLMGDVRGWQHIDNDKHVPRQRRRVAGRICVYLWTLMLDVVLVFKPYTDKTSIVIYPFLNMRRKKLTTNKIFIDNELSTIDLVQTEQH